MDSSVDVLEDNYTDGDHGDSEGAGGRGNNQEYNFVQQLVNSNKVVVFSKTQCPHCTDSKTLLNNMGVQYQAVELDKIREGPQVQNVLGQITDARTVPRIFIGGQCVGGNSDLQSLDQSGTLRRLLQEM